MENVSNTLFNVDEREADTFRRICTVMYIFTIYSLIGILTYRQFILHQPHQAWDDIAILVTINILVFLGSVLFLTGAVNLKKIKIGYIFGGYIGFVIIGLAFTIFKYSVLLGQEISIVQIWDYFRTIVIISSVLMLILGILAYLGSRRIDKQIE
jgi:hypothetical protein